DEDNPNPTELNGLWIAKFETTGTAANPTVKPNLTTLVNQNIGPQFSTSINMSTNPDGAAGGNAIIAKDTGSNTQNLTTQTQSRMVRNTDWGAITYLATSNYGRNSTEVWINNNSSYTTGCAGDSASANSSNSCNQYNTTIGVHASATDNIYGIYGMSGVNEYTLSNRGGISSTSVISTMPQTRYMDIYYVGPFGIKPAASSSTSESYYNFDVCDFSICGGQANFETTTVQSLSSSRQSWNYEASSFVNSTYVWPYRSGGLDSTSADGMFYSSVSNGYGGSSQTFRAALAKF
ncbi:MAG: hypothetical protein LBL08_00990, partial [Candidatus Nomurabacteria bacterium]|nr:hypothetical protein [Candidatus Nomurabacteria bacterium]